MRLDKDIKMFEAFVVSHGGRSCTILFKRYHRGIVQFSVDGSFAIRIKECDRLSVNPISCRVIMIVVSIGIGARHFPSRRANGCDCHRGDPPEGCGQSN